MRIRSYLVVLILLALLPVLAFSAGVVLLEVALERAAVERGLLDTARALGQALDRRLSEAITTLEALAVSPALLEEDFAAFHEYAARAAATQPGWRSVFLLDREGGQIANTSQPFGAPLAPAADRADLAAEVLREGRPAVSDLHVGRASGQPTVALAVPVHREGEVAYVLGASLDLAALDEIFEAQRVPGAWTGAILDGQRRIIARSRSPASYLGHPATDVLARRSSEAAEGVFWDRTQEGDRVFGVFTRSSLSDWTLVLGIPAAVVEGPSQHSLWLLTGAGLLFLGLGVALALVFARRLTIPIAALTRSTAALERGEHVTPPPASPVAELDQLGRALARAAEARRHAEEWLRVTLTSIGDAVIATDASGRIVFLNDTAQALTGWPEAQARGRPLDDVFVVVDETTRQRVRGPVGRVLQEGAAVSLPGRIVLLGRDGAERPIADSAAPMRDASGAVTGVVLVFRDVSERRHAEALRAESEQRFRVLAEAAPVMIWMTGPDGRRTYVNRAWLEFTGRALEAELEDWWSGIHPDDRGRFRAACAEALRTRQPVSAEYRLRRADGVFRWVLDRGVPLLASDGTFTGFLGACLDIHDRKLAEEDRARRLAEATEAREEAERGAELVRGLQRVTDAALARLPLDALLNALLVQVREIARADTAAILLLEDGGRVLVFRAAAGLEGDARERARIPVGEGFAGRVVAEGRPVIVADLEDIEVRNPLLRRRGLRSLLGVPLRVDDRTLGVLHVGTLARREFTPEDAELLQLVADRVALAIEHTRLYEAERQARAEAEAASRAKDEFLATLSHELRTPLNAVVGWARMLREGVLGPEQRARAIEVIERSAAAQARLIDDLLDVSRIISGRMRLDVRPLDLTAVVEAALDAVRPAARAKGIDLRLALDEPVVVNGDAARLQQVIWNLLSNAVKFTPRGGRVDVAVTVHASHAEVAVRDTGAGIAPDVLPYVFDRFRQADSTTTRTHGGLGLGLAIVRHVVELHGGTVSAASAGPGRGATFTVTLPLRPVAPDLPASFSPALAGGAGWPARPPVTLDGLRVLVVDDEPDAREMLTVALGRQGAEVRAAAGVRDALDQLEGFRADVVVTDIAMPDADGFELLRRLRERHPRMPALALTAYARPDDRDRALAAGFDLYAAKPVDAGELTHLIAHLAADRRG